MRRLLLLLLVATAATTAAPAAAALPPIRHVFVIVLENKEFVDTFGPTGLISAPYLSRDLPAKGELLVNYFGVGHNSASNYLAMVSGQPPTPASKGDCPDPLVQVGRETVGPYGLAKTDGCQYPDNFLTIADQLVAKGFTWRGYNQDIPAPCTLLKSSSAPGTHYVRKHNPFVFFDSLRASGQCQANDVGLDALPADLADPAKTPNLAYIVPNECDDGHTACPATFPTADPITEDQDQLRQADAFLRTWVPQILASPAFKQDGLLIVTFDEAITPTACCNEQPGPADPNPGGRFGEPGPGGGQTGTVMVSPFITPGAQSLGGLHLNLNPYNHYSLLRTLEDAFGLTHLGYAGQDGLKPMGSDVFDRGI